MKKHILFLFSLAFLTVTNNLFAQGTPFTYQGQLQSGGSPANGNYDFTFALYNTNATSGTQVGSTLADTNVGVTNGLFAVTLDFGPVFTGNATWLAIAVRTNGGNSFTGLTPLQELTPTPYAIYASNANRVVGSVSASQLTGAIAASNIANGTITSNLLASGSVGSSQLATNVGLWTQVGSNVVYNGGNVGIATTTPNAPLQVAGPIIGGGSANTIAAGLVASTIAGGGVPGYPNSVAGESSFIGAGNANTISSNLDNSIIGAGYENLIDGVASFIGSGNYNSIQSNADFSVVAGGFGNTIGSNSAESFIGSGSGNIIQTNSFDGAIGGGSYNSILDNSSESAIAGGYYNSIETNSGSSFIGSGNGNSIGANSSDSAIAGGFINSILDNSSESAIACGYFNSIETNSGASFIGSGQINTIQAGSAESFIGGGYGNVIQSNSVGSVIGGGSGNIAAGGYATVPGGANNQALGSFSFSAGYNAQALYPGDFVWADTQSSPFDATANDQFNVRAQGGVRFVTGGAGMTLDGQNILANTSVGVSLSGSFSGDGSGLTGLNASQLTSGTIPQAQLPSTVALLSANQTFTGQNMFAGILARGGPPGASGAYNNGYAFSGNGGDDDSGMFSLADGQIEFYNNANEVMRIINGFVGIGTTNPIARLSVDVGNGGGFSDPAAIFAVENCGNACGQPAWTEGARLWNQNLLGRVGLSFMVGGSGALSNTPNVYVGTGDYVNSNDFRIATQTAAGLTDRLYINGTSGNVGIGTTAPGENLSIATSASPAQSATLSLTAGNAHKWLLQSVANDTSGPVGAMQFVDTSTSITNMTLAPNGQVGIGTSVPTTENLVVAGGVDVASASSSPTSDSGLGLSFESYGGRIQSFQQRPLILNPAGNNVGIGTTNPTTTLDVNGSGHFAGSVGIGTASPAVPLDVQSYGAIHVGSGYFYGTTGQASYNVPGGSSISIRALDFVASSGFIASSDARIKQIVGQSDSSKDLATLNKIKVTDYTYIDKVQMGGGVSKKVIAQQLEQVYPQAVSKSRNFIPDIFAAASVEKNGGELRFTLTKPHALHLGDKVRWIDDKAGAQQDDVTKIVSDLAFEVKSHIQPGKVFVYGREVDDFRAVDYEAVSMLNVSATQELARQSQRNAAKVETLEKEVAELKKMVAQLAEANKSARMAAAPAAQTHATTVSQDTFATISLDH